MRAESWPEIPGLRILGALGRGGMGEVVLAEETGVGRRVAVKWIDLPGGGSLDEVETSDRRRFEREARTLARLDHPHLVKVHRLGETEGRLFMVLELVEGGSLSERLHERGRLPAAEALEITHQTVSGLGAAWAQGLVHRDIKPANLLFDREGRIRVADFGLARPVEDEADRVTRTGFIVGSPHYMAPEQIRGEDLDLRSDLYSLGVVLFEMLSGSPPFDGRSQGAILAGHLAEPLPDPRTLRPDLPERTVDLIARLAAKERESRPGSIREAFDAIEGAMTGATDGCSMSASVPGPGGSDRLQGERSTIGVSSRTPARSAVPVAGFGPRHRKLAALVAIVAGLGVVALGGWLVSLDGGEPAPEVSRRETGDTEERKDGEMERGSPGAIPQGLRLVAAGRPAPLDLQMGATAEELVRALEARIPDAGDGFPMGGDRAMERLGRFEHGVRVRVASTGHPLLFHLREDGDLELLHPPVGETAEPVEPGQRVRLPAPTDGAAGWLILAVTTEPLRPPALLGARPNSGRVLYPARLEGATGTIHPAHHFATWLIDNLGAASGRWGLTVRALGPGTGATPGTP